MRSFFDEIFAPAEVAEGRGQADESPVASALSADGDPRAEGAGSGPPW